MTYGAAPLAARNVAHMVMKRTSVAAILAIAAVSGAAGCGSDDSGDSLAEAERLAQAKQEGAREARAEQEARKAAREQRRLRREIQRIRRDRAQASAPSGGNGATPSSTVIPSGGTNCGSGVTAGANTSCAFARNVRDNYYAAGQGDIYVDVYSPTTGQTYSMYCRAGRGGAATLCTGGNNASVSFF
jgi:Flp pilus assembly protein TadG